MQYITDIYVYNITYIHMRKKTRGKREETKIKREYSYQSDIMNNKEKVNQ